MKRFNERRDDQHVVPMIRTIMEERPTYGYKRITAILNKRFGTQFNRKRIYRLMRKEKLLLSKPPAQRRPHTGTGKIMVARPNTRWCSDCFEIHCWNDERVYVAFALDCCDRQAIHFIASDSDILSDGIQQLMLESVERRFGRPQTPEPLQ